jgi:CBS-domain-containing membrane protein
MQEPEILDEDFRAALKEMVGFVDISEQDLVEIYKLALEHARKRVRGHILVEQMMTREVLSVKTGTHPHEAEAMLFEHRISGLPVVDEENRVVGVLSEQDFLYCMEERDFMSLAERLRYTLHKKEYKRKAQCEKVEDLMTAPPITVHKGMTINRVATLLVEKKINRVPVVDEEGRLIGIVSRADLVRMLHNKHKE